MEQIEALVLQTVPYAEEGMVAQVFSREYGYIPLLVRGAKSRSTGVRFRAYLHMFALVRAECSMPRRAGGLAILREVEPLLGASRVVGDMPRGAVAMFLASVLKPLLSEHSTNEDLWGFLSRRAKQLAEDSLALALYPADFLLGLMREFGIAPQGAWGESTPLFSLREGQFVSERYTGQAHILPPELSRSLSAVNQHGMLTPMEQYPKPHRAVLLRAMVSYLEHHTGVHIGTDALDVLEAVWRES